MDKKIMTDYYLTRNDRIFADELSDDAHYQALIRQKIKLERALQHMISDEAWEQYLDLDSICNELEGIRYQTM